MKIFFGLMLVLVGQFALANDFAATVGLRSNSADAATTNVTSGSRSGFGAGVIGFFDVADKFAVRSGFIYNQRNYKLTSGTTEFDMNLSYVDIPVTGMYKFADYAGAFFGPVLSMLSSKECKATTGTCGTVKDPESMIMPIQFGVSFKFAPQMGAELYYEMISSEFWKDQLKSSKTVGINLMYTFE